MPIAPSPWKSVLWPKEHGSWSLAFEPVALGLLVAPSIAGISLTVAITAAFLTRRPLRLALTLSATDPRSRPATQLTLLGLAVAFAGLIRTGTVGSWHSLWPLLLAVPFGGIFLWFDFRNDSREVEAELAGSIAFAFTPAAFAILAGWPAAPALALATLALARNVPAILTVRTYLRLSKGRPAAVAVPLVVSGVALLALFLFCLSQALPWPALLIALLLWTHSYWLLGAFRPDWTGRQLGQFEAGLGAGCVLLSALTYSFP